MRRLLVAATAAVITVPTAVAADTLSASAAPSHVAKASVQSGTSVAAARTASINYANKYSRMATRSSWRQKARNANHLSSLTARARLHHTRRAVLISRTQLGTPYRWGGTTPRGFDCSGYTSYIYAKAGKKLPRTARMQYRATTRTSNPRPGDLVFFGGSRAYHVGIYLGNGRMIHSPRRGKPVQVAKVWRGASYGKVR